MAPRKLDHALDRRAGGAGITKRQPIQGGRQDIIDRFKPAGSKLFPDDPLLLGSEFHRHTF
ncbi:MAG TPA: hypothetical protein VGS58_17500 [Candidatus Sulfopaludibacter sp.]|nr:hypothetical protein [Candidatus Sulfopaludibacter sp.]